jgi:hypothetical protein
VAPAVHAERLGPGRCATGQSWPPAAARRGPAAQRHCVVPETGVPRDNSSVES